MQEKMDDGGKREGWTEVLYSEERSRRGEVDEKEKKEEENTGQIKEHELTQRNKVRQRCKREWGGGGL